MSPRVLAGALGIIAILTAIAFLTTPTSPPGMSIIGCGTPMSPRAQSDTEQAVLCEDSHDDRKAWTIPLGAAGVLVLVGSLVIRPRHIASDPS
jgi:hypothetical protein